MNEENLKFAAQIVDKNFVDLGAQSLTSRENLFRILLSQRCMPEEGWDDLTIEFFLNSLAVMDTNNFLKKTGIGEREARIASDIVARRNYYMGHGIGRSGDIQATQPKAAGASLVAKLAYHLTFDALKICGYNQVQDLILLPTATGMSVTIVLLTLVPSKPKAKYVIWPRIDQKTCFKTIFSANLQPIVIENIQEGDEVTTDLKGIEDAIQKYGAENILAVLSTSSCFAPRVPDKVEEIAKICKQHDLFHVINNAYGLQDIKIANQINNATKNGRVDAVIQSFDKNFMVPVGGALVFSKNPKVIQNISELYPGRGSLSPLLDLLITFLTLGRKGLADALKERKENYKYMREELVKVANKYGEKVLNLPKNGISIGLCLSNIFKLFDKSSSGKLKEISFLGAMLYQKRVMGSKVTTFKDKDVCGFKFKNYGASMDKYSNMPFMTAAAAIGLTKKEVDVFIQRLVSSFDEIKKIHTKMLKELGQSEDKKDETKEGKCESKERKEESKVGKGEAKEKKGESKEKKGESKEKKNEPKEKKGEPKEKKGEAKEKKGEPKEKKSEKKDKKSDSKDNKPEGKPEESKSEEQVKPVECKTEILTSIEVIEAEPKKQSDIQYVHKGGEITQTKEQA